MNTHPLQHKTNKKLIQKRDDNFFEIRVSHRRGHLKNTPRYLFKCGCCDERLEIYYDNDGLEINGVNGSLENWREILLPLLRDK